MANFNPQTFGTDERRVTRAVVWNQGLWTAGYSLTTGGFLTYFGKELGAHGFMIALLLVVPETAGIFGLTTRWLIARFGNRKRVWFWFSLAARLVSLGIPLLAFPEMRPAGVDPLVLMVMLLAISQALQSVAYLAYLSWLSDLVPERHWGRFFSIRNIAKLVVLLVVPVTAGFLRDYWRRVSPAEASLLAYVIAFSVGTILLTASLLPLLRLPDLPSHVAAKSNEERGTLRRSFRNRSLRFLLIHSWWLALANGLTQAAFFGFLYGPLGIGLGTFYVLLSVMRLVKLPVSWISGGICDRFGNKWTLFWGVILTSCAMPFWLWATPATWGWVFGAYAMWGFFAAVNIAGRNLALTLSPRSDNTAPLALFRQVGGLLAGLSGLLGGLWLISLKKTGFQHDLGTYHVEGFQLLFFISWIGRITAAFWILPIRETAIETRESAVPE